MILPSVAYPVYLLAPHEDAIQAFVRSASPCASDRRSGSHDQCCEIRATYKDNSTDANLIRRSESSSQAAPKPTRQDLAPVPEEIWKALRCALNVGEMASYIERASWNRSARVLHPEFSKGYAVLRDKCSRIANDNDIAIGAPLGANARD